MQRPPPSTRILRLVAGLVVAGLVMGASPAPSTIAADGPTIAELRAAETRALQLINVERAAVGLRAIPMDSRIQTVAQARSQDMVDRDYFAHQDPDGMWPWDHLNAAHIDWYGAGEIIAWNMSSPIESSAETAISQWMNSTMGHKEQILSPDHNYAGVGVATDGDRSIWTVVFIQGPDRTDPTASLTKATSPVGSRSIRLAWAGKDPLLATLTAGLKSYDLERRRPRGTWSVIRAGTTRTSLTLSYPRGTRYQFRVRARDAVDNVGDWSAARDVTVR